MADTSNSDHMWGRAIRLAFAISIGLLATWPVNSALTQEALGIAAVVNDEVVSPPMTWNNGSR